MKRKILGSREIAELSDVTQDTVLAVWSIFYILYLHPRPDLTALVIFFDYQVSKKQRIMSKKDSSSGEINTLAEQTSVFRILDANLNRLREGLRVIEEYFRFMKNDSELSIELKGLRHDLIEIEKKLGRNNLISNRDTSTDCFSRETRPEELTRECVEDVVYAGFKRTQEASRVIEEYSKIAGSPEASRCAKTVRFSLYKIEKTLWKALYND